MTTWRYVISREVLAGEIEYTIRELYTDGESLSWSKDPIAARGDTWKECANDLAIMTRAMSAPVLDLTLDPPALVSPLSLKEDG